MMAGLRDYQTRAVKGVRRAWGSGKDSVCLVAPTGSGKTRMGEELIADERPTLWVAHRRELITQTAERLRARFGASEVGVIMPGAYETRGARVQVGTVQTLLARKAKPLADCVVLDEAHHYAAEDWRRMAERYPKATTLGLTATPERQDGEPLGDIFEAMVVAASYSQLVAEGFLVPARVYRPKRPLGNDLAQDPVKAWLRCSEGSRAFLFCGRVADAQTYAKRFRDAGVLAEVIHATTPKRQRDDVLERFRRGRLSVIANVNTMTEGIDVPEPRTVILARAFGHVGGYLQAVGRPMRPVKGKPDMILIDLVGASIRHGLPTDDRAYSLEGRPISEGAGFGEGDRASPEWSQEVLAEDLALVARGALKADETPKVVAPKPVDDTKRKAEYVRLLKAAKKHRMRPGFAAAKYHEKFGEWPPVEWAK